VRPELAAFRELDTLVRNLSDQLAGYRRRALAAESRARELEQAADSVRQGASTVQDRAEALSDQLATATDQLRSERLELTKARASIEELTQSVATAAAETQAAGGKPMSPTERASTKENAELRRRLDMASARTSELSERLRFLRQQLATVPEK
jgi:chromosome segregation ATPase